MNIATVKFLVVDDNPHMRRIVRGLLNEIGCHNVNEAEDGAAALQMLKSPKFDFVISDINMPNVNGFELLRTINSDPAYRSIPVLMVVIEPRREDINLAAQNGAAGYIVKPFTEVTLKEKIGKILSR